MKRAFFRRVVGTEDTTNRYCRPGEGARWHYLECGHSVVTKQSQGFPKRKFCRDCHYESSNKKNA